MVENNICMSMKRAKQWKGASLICASIIGGCLAVAAPVFAATAATTAATTTEAEQIKALQNKVEALQHDVTQLTSGLSRQSGGGEGLPLHGFMDAGYAISSQGANVVANPFVANPSGFYQGSLSFYMTPHFGDNVKALAEPNFEVDKLDGSISVDIERLQVGYTFSDAATVWMGRFHTPYGYWNTAFHHGAQIQTSVLRPRFLDFEDLGGILPSHMIGLWGTGKTRAGSGKFTYDWFAGNGPKISDAVAAPDGSIGNYQSGTLDPNIAGDDNHSAMVGVNLGYEFGGSLDGLRLALHGLQGYVRAYDSANTLLNTTNLMVGGGSLVYLSEDWEIMGEYYGFMDKDNSSDTKYKSRAGYVQVGKSFYQFTPYLRLERTIFDQQDNYFLMQANGQSYARQALGLRYNVNPKAALKFELLNSSFATEPSRTELNYRSLYIQYAIGF